MWCSVAWDKNCVTPQNTVIVIDTTIMMSDIIHNKLECIWELLKTVKRYVDALTTVLLG
jgi:hypothetical protein